MILLSHNYQRNLGYRGIANKQRVHHNFYWDPRLHDFAQMRDKIKKTDNILPIKFVHAHQNEITIVLFIVIRRFVKFSCIF